MRMGAILVSTLLVGLIGGVFGTAWLEWVQSIWPRQMSETVAVLITGFSASGVGLLAVLAAIWGVVSSRTIARRQTTMEQLAAIRSDEAQIQSRKTFNRLVRSEPDIAIFAAKDKEGSDETSAISAVLNEYEMISIGIQMGIIDPEIYKRLAGYNVETVWKNAQPFVVALRTRLDRQSLYHEFEEMARWFNQNRLPHRRFWWAGII